MKQSMMKTPRSAAIDFFFDYFLTTESRSPRSDRNSQAILRASEVNVVFFRLCWSGLFLSITTQWIAPAWAQDPERPYLAVPRTATPPKIDGILNDEVWKTAGCQPFLFDTARFLPVNLRTRTFFAWDDDRLYVAFDCAEPNPDEMMFRKRGRDAGSMDDDDSAQLFIQSPGMETYYRFVINTGGFVFDEHHYDPSWNCNVLGAGKVGEDVWTAEMSIPWAEIGGTPTADQVWRANLVRHRLVGGNRFTQWSRTGPEMRKPHRFGSLRFVDSTPVIHELELGYELPGLNRLTALVQSPTGGATLRIRHAEGKEGVASIPLPIGSENPVELSYPITTHSEEKLVVELAEGEQVYYRQPIKTSLTPIVSATQIHRSLELLSKKAEETENDSFRAALERARDRGEKDLADLDQFVAEAIRAEETIAQEAWVQAAEPVQVFEKLIQQPLLWTQNPLARSGPEITPPEVERLERIDIVAAVNEQEAGALLVRNVFADGDVDLRIEMRPVKREEGEADHPLQRSNIALAEALMIPTRTQGVTGEPISPLGKAGVFHVPLNQAREIWFLVDTTGVSPGTYMVPVTIHPLVWDADVLSVEFELHIEIWDIELPEKMPISVYSFDYTRGLSGNSDYFSDLARCRTDIFHVTGVPSPDDEGHADFTSLDVVLDRLPEGGQAWMEVWFMRPNSWQPHYETWISELVVYMQSRGLDYDRWTLHIFDESASDDFLECARQIKRVDPKFRISQTHMGSPERMREFESNVDIWIPIFRDLDKPGMEVMRESGKPVWMYDCGTTPMFGTSRHRFLPWRAWRYDLDGVTLWTYSQNHWNDPPRDQNFGLFFGAADGGSIPSKRFEAWREGLEDYLYLHLYDAELDKLGELTPEDEDLLDQARELGAEDPSEIEQYDEVRIHIAHRILELRAQHP